MNRIDNVKGTRNIFGKESDRIIDLAIANVDIIIESQYDKDISIADHSTKQELPKGIDRERTKLESVKKAFLNKKYKCLSANCKDINGSGDTLQGYFDSFYNDIGKIIKAKKLLKGKVEAQVRLSDKRITEYKEKCEISKEIKKLVRTLHKERYIKFIEKGCEYMKNHNARDAWKWLKQKSKLNKLSHFDAALKDETENMCNDMHSKLDLMRRHFGNLVMKEKTRDLVSYKTY